ncbi:MAG: N-acetylmannosamine-6-phosphate 2-epimerase [Eubacteriales bacterium]|nr:N-acetylmannosamine-6-phosphate 2-epimerase [Eubacteriales bacterium]
MANLSGEKAAKTERNQAILKQIKAGLIVSCQALEDEIFYRPQGGIMPLFAKAAERGGAVGIRANSVRDIQEIKQVTKLPVIGIIKRDLDDSEIYITPELSDVDQLVRIGCEIIAFDGTDRPRHGGQSLVEFIETVRESYPEQLFMADCSNFEEARICAEHGVNLVGTTMVGYTPYTEGQMGVPFALLERLVKELEIPVIAEGHIATPEELRKAMDLGVHAAVVGSAITRPLSIVERFVRALE